MTFVLPDIPNRYLSGEPFNVLPHSAYALFLFSVDVKLLTSLCDKYDLSFRLCSNFECAFFVCVCVCDTGQG